MIGSNRTVTSMDINAAIWRRRNSGKPIQGTNDLELADTPTANFLDDLGVSSQTVPTCPV